MKPAVAGQYGRMGHPRRGADLYGTPPKYAVGYAVQRRFSVGALPMAAPPMERGVPWLSQSESR
jgi:hypothetical protein